MPAGPMTAALAVVALFSVIDGAAQPPRAGRPVPRESVVHNPIRIATLAESEDGVVTTRVTYTEKAATGEVRTTRSVALARGFRYKLSTCLTFHSDGSAPLTTCLDRLIDTRLAHGPVHATAPVVRLVRPRPSGPVSWAYFAGYGQVTYAARTGAAAKAGAGSDVAADVFAVVAHSWPDNGLQGAGVAVARQGQTRATLPANDPVKPAGPFSGAINTGRADSICRPDPSIARGPLPSGVTSSHPAYRGAPAFYEVGRPTGAFAGRPPLGVMLVIHGGGWYYNGSGATQSDRPVADRWRARGWETVNLTYHACGRSLDDVLWFYDQTRAWLGRSAIVCASGASAGGHLALMLASKRNGVYCVVSQGGPTDLRTVQNQTAYDRTTGRSTQLNGGRTLHNVGAAAFGEENLAAVSPVNLAATYLKGTRVLQGFAVADPLVPYQQATDLRAAMLAANPSAYVDTVQLARGAVSFVHAPVSQAAMADFNAREELLVAPITPMSCPAATMAVHP
ncbi:MAG: hypothetical protein ABJA34_09030 [Pseudonocardiales bacterium]